MNPLLASTALGLIAAWPVGVLGFGLGRLVEGLTDDPRPRAAAWSLAYALPAGALAATVALTFAPVPEPPVLAAPSVAIEAPAAVAAPAWTPEGELATNLALSLAGLSVAGLLARGWRWNRGRRRLAAIRKASEPCDNPALIEAVRLRAARLGVEAPPVRISADLAEPLLAGLRRPVILLPKALVETTDAARLELVCGHELAHLRRGDNWRIPAEEALAGLYWLAPPMAALRNRMLAAREAVCDRIALADAEPEARQNYARVLVEALKLNAAPAVQSAFTGRDRNLVSARLSAILQPRGDASVWRFALVLALGGGLTVATGAGSLALAKQAREIAPPAPGAALRAAATMTADPAPAPAPPLPVAQAAPAAQVAPAAQAAPAAAPAPALAVAAAAPAAWPAPAAPTEAVAARVASEAVAMAQATSQTALQVASNATAQAVGSHKDATAAQAVAFALKVASDVTGAVDPRVMAPVALNANPDVRVRLNPPRDLAGNAIQQLRVTNEKAGDSKPKVSVRVGGEQSPWDRRESGR